MAEVAERSSELKARLSGPVELYPESANDKWLLAQRYLFGVGVHKDRAEALRVALEAAAVGSSVALAWLESEAKSDASARLLLAILRSEVPGELTDKDRGRALFQSAIAELEPRALAGDAEAGVLMATASRRIDPPKVAYWYQRAAEAGNAFAMDELGELYYVGTFVPRDLELAAQWYRRGAEAGNPTSQVNYAYVLYQGEGVAQDKIAAARWNRAGAEQGSSFGQYNLATALILADGIEANQAQAIDWFERAARQGHAKAMLRLGQLHWVGLLVAQDDDRAKELAQRAADRGNEAAKAWGARAAERQECRRTGKTRLFDLLLACVDRNTLRAAVIKNGGRPEDVDDVSRVDVYASDRLLLESRTLTLAYTRAGDLAYAEYDFGAPSRDRFMRVAELVTDKYGVTTSSNPALQWKPKDGIVITLSLDHTRGMRLTYTHPARRAQLDRDVAADRSATRRQEAKQQSKAF